MNIIIIGCGKIGITLAEQLNQEGHDITIVDQNEKVLKNAATKLDVMGVSGNGAMLDVQREAGIRNADILIAVTSSDELNMLCCLIAKKEGTVSTIARIRNPEYEREIDYFKQAMGISMVINPEKMVAHDIVRLMHFPSALAIESFASGKVDMVKAKLHEKSKLCNVMLRDLPKKSSQKALICLIERGKDVIIPTGTTILQANDRISFVASPVDAMKFCEEVSMAAEPVHTAFLIGGGKIAYYIATYMRQRKYRVSLKIIEQNRDRCVFLSDRFPEMTIINGDGSNQQLLIEEGIEGADAFVSLTGIDEENIISSLFAGKLSDARLVTKVNHLEPQSIGELIQGSIVSPRLTTADSVLRYVRGLENSIDSSNIETLYKVADGRAEAVEFTVKQDPKLVNIPLIDLKIKINVLIAAIVRDGKVISPGGSDSLQTGDSVVIITSNRGIHSLSDILL